MFKVNKWDTRRLCNVFIVNFKHVEHLFCIVSIVDFEQVVVSWKLPYNGPRWSFSIIYQNHNPLKDAFTKSESVTKITFLLRVLCHWYYTKDQIVLATCLVKTITKTKYFVKYGCFESCFCKGQGMFHCWVTCSYRLNIFHGKKYT